MFGPSDLEQKSADEVKAIWTIEDQISFKSTNLVEIRGRGYYHETWKLKDRDWNLQTLDLRRTYTKISHTARSFQYQRT
jgi:hypothetical protein